MDCCYTDLYLGHTTLSVSCIPAWSLWKGCARWGKGCIEKNQPTFLIVWDNVAFHHSHAVSEWFAAHPRMVSLFLPPYSPFLNPIEELFSLWRWKVYDLHPHIKCTSWTQWMLDAWTYQQKITRDGSGMPEDSFRGVLPKMTSDVMWMRTCGQMQKTE